MIFPFKSIFKFSDRLVISDFKRMRYFEIITSYYILSRAFYRLYDNDFTTKASCK